METEPFFFYMHIIHRGIVNKSYKENCLKSFRASFKKRFGIETDIHSTKDKKFVCFHDFTLKRIFKIDFMLDLLEKDKPTDSFELSLRRL